MLAAWQRLNTELRAPRLFESLSLKPTQAWAVATCHRSCPGRAWCWTRPWAGPSVGSWRACWRPRLRRRTAAPGRARTDGWGGAEGCRGPPRAAEGRALGFVELCGADRGLRGIVAGQRIASFGFGMSEKLAHSRHLAKSPLLSISMHPHRVTRVKDHKNLENAGETAMGGGGGGGGERATMG